MALRLILLTPAATRAQQLGNFADADDSIMAPSGSAPAWPAAGGRIRAVLCSPTLAARQTAALMGLDPGIDNALRDINPGAWRGRRLADVAREDSATLAAMLTDPGARPPQGESLQEVADRATPWLERSSTAPGPLLAITHAAVVRVLVARAIGASLEAALRIDIAPLSCTILSFRGRWRLQTLGLPLEPVTAAG